MQRISFYIICLLLVSSCNLFNAAKQPKEDPLARVYDKLLYPSDIPGVGRGAVTAADSIEAVRNYIDSWVHHNLILRYSQDNLPDDEQHLNDRLRDYKESLLIYQYENDLMNQKLDTFVKEADVESYYTDHKDIFRLKDQIIKVRYVVVPQAGEALPDSVRLWLQQVNDYSVPKLEGFCRQYASRYSVHDSTWYNKDDVSSFLPVARFNFSAAVLNRSYIEVKDSGNNYLMKFDDFRLKGGAVPIEFVREEIGHILINQRKIAFVSRMHQSIYDDALKNGAFEVFMNNEKKN